MLDKEELEKTKLQCEINEIEQRIKSESKKAKWEMPKAVATITLTFISVAIGITTIWTKSATFLEQRGKEQSINLSRQMIDLVNQLNSEDSVKQENAKQENAAILLSYYKKDAIPILLRNLQRAENPDATIESLKLIKEDTDLSPQDVINSLKKSAKKVFATNKETEEKTVRAFKNYITALGELGTERKNEVINLLQNLKNRIEKKGNDSNLELSTTAQHIITTAIDSSLARLQK